VQHKEFDMLVLLVPSCSRSIAAYLGIYKDAYNYLYLEDKLKYLTLYTDRIRKALFGDECSQALAPEGMKFLSIELSSTIKPNLELDV
jgi:hypothetical protein